MKQLFGIDTLGSYSFDASAQTITFSGLTLSLDNILVINNATANTLIYNFASSTTGAASFTNNVLTLDYDTSSMNDADKLQIWVDVPQQSAVLTKDKNSPDSVLTRMYHLLSSPMGYDKSIARQRVTALLESGTVTTVTTVSTVTTLSNQTNIGGFGAQEQLFGISRLNFASLIRSRIA